jgi:hypothetical protein
VGSGFGDRDCWLGCVTDGRDEEEATRSMNTCTSFPAKAMANEADVPRRREEEEEEEEDVGGSGKSWGRGVCGLRDSPLSMTAYRLSPCAIAYSPPSHTSPCTREAASRAQLCCMSEASARGGQSKKRLTKSS